MITDISLQNFRSYDSDSFELSPNVNIIVGPNASGKTNLLESILVVSRGSSYRARDKELINFDKDWAKVEAHSNNFSRVAYIERVDDKTDKTFTINTQKIKRLNLSQTIPIILFEPNHLLLLIGSPELRRSFMDDILEQTVTGFKSLKNQYRRALAQRNSLLKQMRQNLGIKNEMFVWNIRLSELAGQIFKQRTNLITQIQNEIDSVYDAISGGSERIKLNYHTECKVSNYESDLLNKLEKSIDADSLKGFTSYGPHKDDVKFLINNNLAGDVASRGETRTILLALKIIETHIVEKARDQKPILLFDDVFSELDGSRRLALTKTLNNYQTFITTTDADIVIKHYTESAKVIPLG